MTEFCPRSNWNSLNIFDRFQLLTTLPRKYSKLIDSIDPVDVANSEYESLPTKISDLFRLDIYARTRLHEYCKRAHDTNKTI